MTIYLLWYVSQEADGGQVFGGAFSTTDAAKKKARVAGNWEYDGDTWYAGHHCWIEPAILGEGDD